jgi:hypothetical protein
MRGTPNHVSLVVFGASFIVSFIVYWQVFELPYAWEIFTSLGLFVGVLFLIAVFKKWSAVRVFSSEETTSQFLFHAPLSKKAVNSIVFSELLNSMIYFVYGVAFVYILEATFIAGCIALAISLEGIIYVFYNTAKKHYGLGLTKKTIISCKDQFTMVRLKNVKSVELKYNNLCFIYKNNDIELLEINSVNGSNRASFINTLKNIADARGIYVSGMITAEEG